MYCHLHSQMSATIVVFDHPFFATPEIDGLHVTERPPGTYARWLARARRRAEKARLRSSRTALHADISLPVEDAQ